MVEQIGSGEPKPADSSAVKVNATETLIDVYRTLLGIVGPFGVVREGSPEAIFRGRMEKAARAAQINTFGGGVNDVQREIIAAAGLGMKRGAR
jgi:alkylation response protein AidB-like acyl-CoA dehydrogenase